MKDLYGKNKMKHDCTMINIINMCLTIKQYKKVPQKGD